MCSSASHCVISNEPQGVDGGGCYGPFSVKAPSDDGFGVHPIKTGAHGDGVLAGTATAVTATIMTGLFFFIFLGWYL